MRVVGGKSKSKYFKYNNNKDRAFENSNVFMINVSSFASFFVSCL